MSAEVAALLRDARRAPASASPVDAVMGEDWGIVELDRAGRAHIVATRWTLRRAHARRVQRVGRGGGLPGQRAQVVVKMIRAGGAKNVAGLKAQMDYLAKGGEAVLRRSDEFFGIEIDDEEVRNIAAAWAMPRRAEATTDRTSHFIVSFPEGTDLGAAERAGRSWAFEMFGSGEHGQDRWDYYTAFHTDRAHPHTHVVVHRRGLDHGRWLKVSMASEINYQSMRALAAEVGQAEGIDVEATDRLARGDLGRTVSDAEVRRAAREERAPHAPARSRASAVLTAAAVLHHARRYAHDAAQIEKTAPELAEQLRQASEALASGQRLTREHASTAAEGEGRAMNEQLERAREEARTRFETIDRELDRLPEGADRVRLMREAAALKADMAPHMGDERYGDYQRPAPVQDYQGVDPIGADGPQIKAEADREVRGIAARYGVHDDATVERYSGGPPSKALADEYRREEARERDRTRAGAGVSSEGETERESALRRMHQEIASVYQAARESVRQQVELSASQDAQRPPQAATAREDLEWTRRRDDGLDL